MSENTEFDVPYVVQNSKLYYKCPHCLLCGRDPETIDWELAGLLVHPLQGGVPACRPDDFIIMGYDLPCPRCKRLMRVNGFSEGVLHCEWATETRPPPPKTRLEMALLLDASN